MAMRPKEHGARQFLPESRGDEAAIEFALPSPVRLERGAESHLAVDGTGLPACAREGSEHLRQVVTYEAVAEVEDLR